MFFLYHNLMVAAYMSKLVKKLCTLKGDSWQNTGALTVLWFKALQFTYMRTLPFFLRTSTTEEAHGDLDGIWLFQILSYFLNHVRGTPELTGHDFARGRKDWINNQLFICSWVWFYRTRNTDLSCYFTSTVSLKFQSLSALKKRKMSACFFKGHITKHFFSSLECAFWISSGKALF